MSAEWFVDEVVDVRWRMWLLTRYARAARNLHGNYAEFGVYRGGCSRMVLATADLEPTRRLHLFDTFEGIPDSNLTESEREARFAGRLNDTSAAYVAELLTPWDPIAQLWPGDVFETFPAADTGELAFVHIDLNAAAPTVHVLEHTYDRLVPGAIVVFDDYGFPGYEVQRGLIDAFLRDRREDVIALPDGPGRADEAPMTSARALAERGLGGLQAKLDAAGAPPGVVRLAAARRGAGTSCCHRQGREVARVRRQLARRFLEGDGLEVGALNLPLWMPRGARVRYVDRKPLEGLRAEYPEWAAWDIVAPDIVADGETLDGIPDASADFVVANHFLEHTEDPIGTLASPPARAAPRRRRLLAVPDKRFTFDVRRPCTPVEHIWPRPPRRTAALAQRALPGVGPPRRARCPRRTPRRRPRAWRRERASIHFHVWTPDAFAELLVHCRGEAGLPLEIEVLQPVRQEFIAIVRKTG